MNPDRAAPMPGDQSEGSDSVPIPPVTQVPTVLGQLKQFSKETLSYGLASAMASVLGLLVLPVLTGVLTPGEYGLVATAMVVVALLTVVSALGMDAAAARWFWDEPDLASRGAVASMWFWSQFLLSVMLGGLLAALAPFLAPLMSDQPDAVQVFQISACLIPLNALRMVAGGWLRFNRRTILAASYIAGGTVTTIGGMVFFVMVFEAGATGAMLGQVGGSTAAALLGLLVVGTELAPTRLSRKKYLGMLGFGLPLVPGALAIWVATSSDRILLGALTDDAQVGVYAVAALVALALALLTQAFRMAWAPYVFSIYRAEGAGRVFSSITSGIVWLAATGAVLLSVAAPWVVRVIAAPSYRGAASAVPFLAFAEVAVIATVAFSLGATLARTTVPIAAALVVGAFVNVCMNLVLIPSLGYVGASMATVIGMSAGAVFMYVASQRLYRVPFNLYQIVTSLVLAAVLVACSQAIPSDGLGALLARACLLGPMFALPFLNGMLSWRSLRLSFRNL